MLIAVDRIREGGRVLLPQTPMVVPLDPPVIDSVVLFNFRSVPHVNGSKRFEEVRSDLLFTRYGFEFAYLIQKHFYNVPPHAKFRVRQRPELPNVTFGGSRQALRVGRLYSNARAASRNVTN